MKLITRFELAACSESDLHGLHRAVTDALVRSPRESAERRNCLASLENIERELASRLRRLYLKRRVRPSGRRR